MYINSIPKKYDQYLIRPTEMLLLYIFQMLINGLIDIK